jgi:hypothetical protein
MPLPIVHINGRVIMAMSSCIYSLLRLVAILLFFVYKLFLLAGFQELTSCSPILHNDLVYIVVYLIEKTLSHTGEKAF